MELKPLSGDLTVTAQIMPEDLGAIAAAGFRQIICNRPDGETPGQPSFAAIEKAASAAGLKAICLPVAGPPLPAEVIAAFGEAIDSGSGPTLAYCRSGMRSTMLWAMSQSGKRDPGAILAAASAAGYDLTPLAPMLGAPA